MARTPKTPMVTKLSRKVLKLIDRDLKRIAGMIDNQPPGAYDLTLTRYFGAVMDKEKSVGKFEDELRRRLKSMSKKQLLELAGVGAGDGDPKKKRAPTP